MINPFINADDTTIRPTLGHQPVQPIHHRHAVPARFGNCVIH